MGMYTELNVAFKLKEDTPKEIVEIIEQACGPYYDADLPFGWPGMFQHSSYYFDADPGSSCRLDKISKQYHVSIRCNFKNYGSEIENFMEWVWPHLDLEDYDVFLGYKRYEEDDLPTLILNQDGKLVWHKCQL